MEVHHHSKHRGAGWKAHLLEFAMLFAAVTLGFFAENLREHYVERHRAADYLRSIAADLDTDIANIDATLKDSQVRLEAGIEAMALYASGEYQRRMADFYYDIRIYSTRDQFVPAVNGIQQLRAAGGVRLIGDRRILDALQHYQILTEQVVTTQEGLERMTSDFRVKSATVMDFRVNHSMYADPTNADRFRRWNKPPGNPPLLDQDPVHLNELMNSILFSTNTQHSRIIRLKALREKADALRILIRSR